MVDISALCKLFIELIFEYLSKILINSLSLFCKEYLQYENLSNTHAKEVIEINNNGHITMPPDLKSSNKKTYNKDFNYTTGKRRIIKSLNL